MKIGIDLGGSHIAVALIENNKEIIKKLEYDITKDDKIDITEILKEKIINFIKQLTADVNIKNIDLIGIAAPGIVTETKIIKADNLNLYNFDIAKIIQKEFNVKILLRNDAKCAALAEKYYGSLKNYSDSIFINIGTGIGGAVFINNKMLKPKESSGFEFGHMIIQKDGKICSCGSNGCFESYCSIKALKEEVKNKLNIEKLITGKELYNIITDDYYKEKLEVIIDKYTKYLAIGISNLINIFEPEIISIGGSFSYYENILLNFTKKNIKIFNNTKKTDIIMAEFKNDAGLIGSVIK